MPERITMIEKMIGLDSHKFTNFIDNYRVEVTFAGYRQQIMHDPLHWRVTSSITDHSAMLSMRYKNAPSYNCNISEDDLARLSNVTYRDQWEQEQRRRNPALAELYSQYQTMLHLTS